MNIKKLNEELGKVLKEEVSSIDTMLYDRYISYNGCEKDDEGHTYYDFCFIYFNELSEDAFNKVLPHVDELQIEEEPFKGVVFFTSGDNLSDIEDGYINSDIEVQDGITLNNEILNKFDEFRNKVYRKYIKFAGYKNIDGDINDIAPVKVDFVIEKNDNIDYEDVLAVFPEIDEGNNRCQCYRHVGQHGTTSFDYYKSLPKATKEQYMSLYNELTNQIGYNLNVMNED